MANTCGLDLTGRTALVTGGASGTFDPERFSLILRVMLEAPFRLARVLLPGMYERGWGRVVNISSVHGHRASAYKSAYVSAKHGLEGLSKTIALEAAGRGVTSNTVCPGYVRTPVKRLVEPDEVAACVAYLCGPAPTRSPEPR